MLELQLYLSFPFHASVLIPGLDLQLGEPQLLAQVGPVGRGQVLLCVEALLEAHELQLAEHGPAAPTLAHAHAATHHVTRARA